MKFKIEAATIRNAWQQLATVTPTRTTMPAAMCVLVEANFGEIKMSSTDLEVFATLTVPCGSIDKQGAALLNASRMLAIFKRPGIKTVEIEVKGNNTIVKVDGGKYDVPTESPDGFPVESDVNNVLGKFTATAEQLWEAIDSVEFAAAREDGKYNTKSVYVTVNESVKAGPTLQMVATDGKKLALFTDSLSHSEGTCRALLPVKSASVLKTFLGGTSGDVTVEVKANTLAIVAESWRVMTRLVEGRFPPYESVIPAKGNATVTLNVDSFKDAVQSAAIMTDDESKMVKFGFGPETTLTCQSSSAGKSEVQFTPDNYDGKPINIAVDPQYIVESLRIAGRIDKTTKLSLINGDKPIVFRSGTKWLGLIVPLTEAKAETKA